MAVLGLGFYIRLHILAIQNATVEVPVSSHEKLRSIGLTGLANNFLTRFWVRQAKDKEARGDFEPSLLYLLKAINIEENKKIKDKAGQIAFDRFGNLIASFQLLKKDNSDLSIYSRTQLCIKKLG